MSDKYKGHQPGLTSPGCGARAIVPNDSQDLQEVTRALYVGNTGNVRVELADGGVVTFRSMQAGALYPLRIRKVFAQDTNASDLVAIW